MDWEVDSTEPMPTGTTAGNNPWEVDSEEPLGPQGPKVAQPADFKQEGAYQAWLDDHKPDPKRPQDVEFKGTGFEHLTGDDGKPENHTLTVMPDGTASSHDLRGLFNQYARPNPITGQKELEPTASMLDEYALPGSRGFTSASNFAQGVPPDQLGSWDDDHTQYHPPGWQPTPLTQKAMDEAKGLASAAYGNLAQDVSDAATVAKTPAALAAKTDSWRSRNLAQEQWDEQHDPENLINSTIVDPLVSGAQKARQGAAATIGSTTELNGAGNELAAAQIAAAEKATPPKPAFRRAADEQMQKAGSAFGVLDAYLSNPRAALASAMEGLSEGGTSLALATAGGAAGGMVAGGPSGAALGTIAGAAGGGYFDAYGQSLVASMRAYAQAEQLDMSNPDDVKSMLDDPHFMAQARLAAKNAGVPAAVINAASFGVAGKVFKPVATAVTSKVGSDLAGKAAGVAAEAGTQGGIAGAGEAVRQEAQEGGITDKPGIAHAAVEQAVLGGVFAGMHARGERDADFEEAGDRNGRFQNRPGFDTPPGSSPPVQDAEFRDVQRLPPDQRALAAPEVIAQHADDAGDITVSHGPEGSVVSVNDEPVVHTDDPKEAETIATDAKQAVEERRIDLAQRQRVADMTPDEMRQALLTHELTGIPNRRAYDESEKLPVQASIDMDSLKWVNDNGLPKAGDALLKAAATAFHDAAPGNAYHISGDEFRIQGPDHATVDQAIAEARERLAGAKIEFTGPEGDKVTLNGIGFSHGKGSTLAEADRALKDEKLSREQQGLRAARGDEPPGTSRTPAGEGLQDHESNPAAQEVVPPSFRDENGRPISLRDEFGNLRPAAVTVPIKPVPSKPLSADEQADVDAALQRKPVSSMPGHTHLGQNPMGEELHEDKNGIRTVVQADGQKVTEKADIIPTRGGFNFARSDPDNPRFNVAQDYGSHGDAIDQERQELYGGHPRLLDIPPAESTHQGDRSNEPARLSAATEPPADETNPPERETYPDLSEPEGHFVETVRDRTLGAQNQKPVANLVEARKMYGDLHGRPTTPADYKRVDELVERAVVEAARSVVAEGDTPQATYDRLVTLYERQPSLNTRTSTSIENQAYSTPAPLAFLSSDLAGINRHTTVLEPTAGNGMLLIGADPAMATVNELNDDRAASLKGQGFNVTQKDASEQPLAKDVDAVIMNPPFGVVKVNGESKQFAQTTPKGEPFKTTEIDHAIVLKQLESMKPDGRAVLLIGGVNKLANTPEKRSDAYNGAAKRKFFYHLYNNYNVVDHFTVTGDLYSRQGAAWPIDAIVIHGVGKSSLPLPAASPPRVYDSYDALKSLLGKTYAADRLDTATQAPTGAAGGDLVQPSAEARQGNLPQPAGNEAPESRVPVAGVEPRAGGEPVSGGTVPNGAPEGRGKLPGAGPGAESGAVQLGNLGEAHPLGAGEQQIAESETPTGRELDGTPKPPVGETESGRQPESVGIGDGGGDVGAQEPYRPQSKQNNLGTLVPGNMRDAVRGSLEAAAQEHGSPDDFVAKELGYPPQKLGQYFAAEQVDALALAIQQMKAGKGFIIGDQTGIGKGRVVAGVIRWAIRQGHTPIFLTEKPNLYGDIVRDLRDIGQEDIRPLLTDSDTTVPIDGGGVLKTKGGAAHNRVLQEAVNSASLPQHNMLFTTYNQMQTISGKEALRHQLVNTLMPNAILILDESHNAGGTIAGRSNKKTGDKAGEKTGRAAMIRGFVNRAKGVFYSSATYAKRPDVMDLYSKTDMRLAVYGNVDKLPGAIAAGGVPLQQVVASMLARSGQYIRRERSFEGVAYNTPVVPVSRPAAEALSKMMLHIKEFDDLKKGAVKNLKDEAKSTGQSVGETGEAGQAGATSTNFTSLMHNLIGQMLLSLKADKAASMAIEHLKAGKKPVITVANTMGSFIQDYAEEAGLKNGDAIGLSFKDLMTRYLESSRQVTIKDHNGIIVEKRPMTDGELGPSAIAAFKRAKAIIDASKDIREIPISPIDWMHMRLKQEGYKSDEITGRSHTIEYQPDGTAIYKLRPEKDKNTEAKVKKISAFNNGSQDVMILNQAGATGLSLHASSKFKDQRQRTMIIAQAEGNIDTHMQMLGRIHRTGQVTLPEFHQLVGDIPAEKRPAAILAKKMASLSANTTGARGNALSSKESVDFINDYGDEVAAQLMADLPEVHEKLGEPLKTGDDGFEKLDAARKVTGRIPMLPVEQQEEIYALLESGYKERLAQADAMGENALEAKTLPLDAKTLKKHVLFSGSNADSPFADGAYAETSDVKRVGKPFTSEQVREQVAETLGFEGAPALPHLADRGQRVMQQTAQDVRKEYQQYRTAEEKKMLETEAQEAAIEGRLTALDGIAKRWFEVANTLHPGGSYEFRMQDGSSLYGVVTAITRKKGVKMPTALGSWVAKIALADGARQTTLAFSKFTLPQYGEATNKVLVTPASQHAFTRVPIEKMFDDGQSTSREQRVIVTGNLLAGFSTIKGGQVINFTSESGQVRQGIMMPRSFKLEEFVGKAPVSVPPEKMTQFLSAAPQAVLKSKDGNVELQRWGGDYALMVSKSKADGGRYYLDPGLRRLVGDFVSVGSSMRAMLRADQVAPAMRLIADKFDQKFETTTHREEALKAGGSAIGSQSADRLARGEPSGSMTRDEVQGQAQSIIDGFKVKPKGLVVVQSAKDLLGTDMGPNMRGAVRRGNPVIASYFPGTGKIYVVADAIKSPEHLAGIMAHEMVVHFGLRAMLGSPYSDKYRALLANIAKALPAATDFHGRREIPNYDPSHPDHRQLGAEEALAYYAQRQAENGKVPAAWRQWVDKVHQIVRDWLRKLAGLPKKFDDLYVRNVLRALRENLKSGTDRSAEGLDANAMPADTFYSAVERAVDAAKREKGTGAEWEATLRNMPGVKPEEMQWLGLKDWLQDRGRVTKAEVADYVRAHRIQVGERLYGMGGTSGTEHIGALRQWMEDNEDSDEVTADHDSEKLIRSAAEGDADAIGHLEGLGVPYQLLAPFYDTGIPPMSAADIETLNDRMMERYGKPLDPDQLRAAKAGGRDVADLLEQMENRLGIDLSGISRPTKEQVDSAPLYAPYVAPGGKNYREMLLTLPERLGERGPKGWGDTNGGTLDAANYRSGHFDGVPNILVHARFDERRLPTGERTLHIAEIQSDWHHAGRQHGYRTEQELAKAREKQQEFTAKRDALRQAVLDAAVEHGMQASDARAMLTNDFADSGTPEAPGSVDWQQRRSRVPEPVRAAMLAYHATNADVAAMARLDLGPQVPDAPFKTTWQDLALKRLLRYAVDKGFDAVSWDTGQTVAERFGLAKNIDSLIYNGRDLVAYDKAGVQVHRSTGHNQDSIAQLVGKDIAQRLVQQTPKNGLRMLSGLDLNTGSEGKKAIYDQMLPQKMGKLVKPWGGTVQQGHVGEAPYTDIKSAQERHPIPAHIVRITPQMSASVRQGLPLFALGERPMFARAADDMGVGEPNDSRTFLGRPGLLGKTYDLGRRAVMSPFTNPIAMDIRKILNPRSLSDMSKLAANRMVPFLADLARQKEMALERLEAFSREVDRLPYKDQLQAYHEAETGQPQSIPQMQPVMDALQKMLRDKAEQVQAMGPGHLDTFIDNYLPHYYTDQSKAKKFFAGPFGRRPLRGPATFKKQRYYATLRDAMEKGGLTPLTANPLIQTFLKLYEMDRYMMGVSMLKDGLKADGLAKYFPIGKRLPEGWAEIDDPIARVSSWSEEERGFVQRGRYAMPEDAARLLNNHLGVNHLANFSPAMTLRALANSMTMFQLGFSGFHVGFTSMDALVSKNALAYERLFNGEPGRAASAFVESLSGPVGAMMNLRRGRLLAQAYLNPTGSTPEMQIIANAFVGGGGRIRMPIEYQTAQGISPFRGVTLLHLGADLRKVMRDPQSSVLDYTRTLGSFPLEYANKYWRTLTDMARTTPVWQLPFEALGRVVRASTGFIMEKIVPWQKQGVFVDMARDYLRRNPTATPTEVNAEMQRITHSIDNRLGEVVYDNNFWNRSFKMTLHLSLRAVGWRFGTVQELGGGAHDFLKAADTLLRTGRLSAKDFTHKMAYLMGLITMQGISGALLQYLMTGEAPKDIKDLMFPRTGYFKKDGSAERLSLPTYIKDMYGYLTQPGHEVASMLNPILGELYYQMTNADYFGDPIYDPDDSGWEQFLERADHFASAYTPFVVQGTQHLEAAQRPGVVGALARVGNFFGAKPAPKSITNPQAITEREHYEDQKRYEKKLRYDLKAARAAGDTEKALKIRERLHDLDRELQQSHRDYLREKAKTRQQVESQGRGGNTSQTLDRIHSLIDGSQSTQDAAQRLAKAGFPALGGLVASLPPTIRPAMAARLREYA